MANLLRVKKGDSTAEIRPEERKAWEDAGYTVVAELGPAADVPAAKSEEPKRGPGRPKGSTNKPKTDGDGESE